MTPSRIFWTQRLAVHDDQYVKVVAHSSGHGEIRTERVPLFRATGPSLKHGFPDVNWGFADAPPPGWKAVEESVQMDPTTLALAPEGTPFPVPTSPQNPLYRFEVAGTLYLVDAVSLTQRFVALQEKLFAALMSPFRSLIIRAHREHGVVSLVVNTKFLYTTSFPLTILSDPAASCIAYWTSLQCRLDELARCGASILRGEPLAVPRLDCPTLVRVRGITDAGVTYVQSLMPALNGPGARKALWHDGWTSIRLVEARKGVGQQISSHSLALDETQSWLLTAGTREKRQRRRLSDREVEEVRRSVGWTRN